MCFVTVLLLLTFLVLVLCVMFPLAVVIGKSMLPTYKEGEILLCRRIIFKKSHKYNSGDVYILRTPYADEDVDFIIKRVSFTYKDERDTLLYICGDNPKESYDSRMYGSVSSSLVIAKVLFILKKESGSHG